MYIQDYMKRVRKLNSTEVLSIHIEKRKENRKQRAKNFYFLKSLYLSLKVLSQKMFTYFLLDSKS